VLVQVARISKTATGSKAVGRTQQMLAGYIYLLRIVEHRGCHRSMSVVVGSTLFQIRPVPKSKLLVTAGVILCTGWVDDVSANKWSK